MKTNKKLDPHANEFSLIVVRKVEVMFYNDRSSDTAFLGTHRKFSKVSILLLRVVKKF